MKKRVLSCVCAALMLSAQVLTAMPVTVFADESEEFTSGSAGENITWNFDTDTAALTFSGSGDMFDYGYESCLEWIVFDIDTIIFEEGITSIGDYACANIRCNNISIPSTVTRIGRSAFLNSVDLTAVTVPGSVKKIYEGAFHGCSGLKTLTLEPGISVIGEYAFEDCTALTAVDLPEGVTVLESSSFYGCKELAAVTFPESISSIGSYAFRKTAWLEARQAEEPLVIEKGILIDGTTYTGESLEIPEGVRVICGYAFAECVALDAVTFPASLKTIGDNAFIRTPWFESRQAENQLVIENDILLSASAYTDAEVIIPDGVKSISPYAFYNCSEMTSLTIPESVEEIGARAFSNCTALTSIRIPDQVQVLPTSSFLGCSQLAEVKLPAELKEIGDFAFQSCTALKEITFPESTAYIGEWSLTFCEELRSVTIPKNAEIGHGVFYDCPEVTLYGYRNSPAERYAAEAEIPFVYLEGESQPAVAMRGDTDENNTVDVSDAVLLARYLAADMNVKITAQGMANADADASGETDSDDVIYILRMIAQLV